MKAEAPPSMASHHWTCVVGDHLSLMLPLTAVAEASASDDDGCDIKYPTSQ